MDWYILYRKYHNNSLFVVPELMIYQILHLNHDDMGHVGLDKTSYNILQSYWFPNLQIRTKVYIDNCLACLSHTGSAGNPEGELNVWQQAKKTYDTMNINHFGPLDQLQKGTSF